jgi:hypothetical protein
LAACHAQTRKQATLGSLTKAEMPHARLEQHIHLMRWTIPCLWHDQVQYQIDISTK